MISEAVLVPWLSVTKGGRPRASDGTRGAPIPTTDELLRKDGGVDMVTAVVAVVVANVGAVAVVVVVVLMVMLLVDCGVCGSCRARTNGENSA